MSKTKKHRKHYLSTIINDNNHEVIAEIGVDDGLTAEYILNNSPSIKYYLMVDPWVPTGPVKGIISNH